MIFGFEERLGVIISLSTPNPLPTLSSSHPLQPRHFSTTLMQSASFLPKRHFCQIATVDFRLPLAEPVIIGPYSGPKLNLDGCDPLFPFLQSPFLKRRYTCRAPSSLHRSGLQHS